MDCRSKTGHNLRPHVSIGVNKWGILLKFKFGDLIAILISIVMHNFGPGKTCLLQFGI